jgi:putative DNA primase/helicase
LPRIREVDDAIFRRVKILTFPLSLASADRDPRLRERLLAEAPGILAWVVRGAIEARDQGLGRHPRVDQAIAEYRADVDVIGRFLEDNYVLEPGGREWSADLHLTYSSWCAESGEPRLSAALLAPLLRNRGLSSHRSTAGRMLWTGLRQRGGASKEAA